MEGICSLLVILNWRQLLLGTFNKSFQIASSMIAYQPPEGHSPLLRILLWCTMLFMRVY